MTVPRVCVVIPTLNRPGSLNRAVASVLDQGEAGVEVVVVDDGSFPAVGRSGPIADERVRLLRNERPRGPAAARNQGAAASAAPLIAFLDDDDRWLPGKLEACLTGLEEHPDAVMVEHRSAFDGDRELGDGRCRLVEEPLRRMLVSQPPHLDGVVVRRDAHERVLFDEGMVAAEDLDYLLRLAREGPVVTVDRVLALITTDPGGSAISRRSRVQGRLQLHEKHADLFLDRRAEAFYQLRLGHQYRRAGQPLRAARSFLRAARQSELRIAGVKGVLATAVPPGWR